MYIYFGGSYGKESSSNADLGLIPGSERSLGEGNGYPLQYHCLENSMDRGAWWATSAGLQRIRQDWATNTFTFIYILNNKICREKRYIIGANGHFYNDHKIIYSICICGCDMCVCVSLLLKKKNLATPCGMWDLSSPPVIEPTPPALEAWSQNHWAVREVPISLLFFSKLCISFATGTCWAF